MGGKWLGTRSDAASSRKRVGAGALGASRMGGRALGVRGGRRPGRGLGAGALGGIGLGGGSLEGGTRGQGVDPGPPWASGQVDTWPLAVGRLEVAFLGTSLWAIAECKRRQEGRDRYDCEPLLDSYGIFFNPDIVPGSDAACMMIEPLLLTEDRYVSRERFRSGMLLWLIVGVAWLAFPGQSLADEPRYQGRTFAEWQGDLGDRSPEVRQRAVGALAHFGPTAVPALTRTTKDVTVQVRQAAVWTLGGMGPVAKDAVPALAQALADLNVHVRQTAAWALAAFGPAAENAVPELARAMSDPSTVVRANAAEALRAIGPAAKDAALALARATLGGHSYVGGNAANALKAIGPAAVSQLRKEVERDPDLQPFLELAIHIIGDR